MIARCRVELHRARNAIGEIGLRPIGQKQVLAVGLLVFFGVVLFDEGTCSADEEHPDEIAPILCMLALLKSTDGTHVDVAVPPLELPFATNALEVGFRTNAKILVRIHE